MVYTIRVLNATLISSLGGEGGGGAGSSCEDKNGEELGRVYGLCVVRI